MNVLVTGSNGLIGSEACRYFAQQGFTVHGIDNNNRARFLGKEADTRWNQRKLMAIPGFEHHERDIRYHTGMEKLIQRLQPVLLVHAAAQPAHEVAARMPLEDFQTNAVGTLNLLEACRTQSKETRFVYLSSSKVYGDINRLPLVEGERRFDFDYPWEHGIDEKVEVDQSLHTLYGVSKLSGDLLVQEYGRYFGMLTCCLRANCMTGPNHSAVALHGFLNYIVRCAVSGQTYYINGYGGKQVRDNLHAEDVVRFIHEVYKNPRSGEVYNLGGGKANSCSILEAIALVEAATGRKLDYEFKDECRMGDHKCYYTDLRKARRHYPNWHVSKTLSVIVDEIVGSLCHENPKIDQTAT